MSGVSASFWWTYLGAFIGGAWTMLVGHRRCAALYPKLEVARGAADRRRRAAAGIRQAAAAVLACSDS